MIHEEICTYEVCKLAKEKGFNWHPPMYFHSGVKNDLREVGRNGANPNNIPYSPHISCPTQTQLQRWMREEKGIEVNAFWDNADNIWLGYAQEMDVPDLAGSFPLNKPFPSYELALEDALKFVLENLV